MATETKKKDPKKEAAKRLSEISTEIKKLQTEKAELNKIMVQPELEVPLHQLNVIARVGAKEAKKQLGKNWVE